MSSSTLAVTFNTSGITLYVYMQEAKTRIHTNKRALWRKLAFRTAQKDGLRLRPADFSVFLIFSAGDRQSQGFSSAPLDAVCVYVMVIWASLLPEL